MGVDSLFTDTPKEVSDRQLLDALGRVYVCLC